jgi:hypothetical protein
MEIDLQLKRRTCRTCKRIFGSHYALLMHYWTSPFHNKKKIAEREKREKTFHKLELFFTNLFFKPTPC